MEKAAQNMKSSPEKEELLKKLRTRRRLQKAYDAANTDNHGFLRFSKVSYELLKEITDILLPLELDIMKMAISSDDAYFDSKSSDVIAEVVNEVMCYREKWDMFNECFESEIENLIKNKYK